MADTSIIAGTKESGRADHNTGFVQWHLSGWFSAEASILVTTWQDQPVYAWKRDTSAQPSPNECVVLVRIQRKSAFHIFASHHRWKAHRWFYIIVTRVKKALSLCSDRTGNAVHVCIFMWCVIYKTRPLICGRPDETAILPVYGVPFDTEYSDSLYSCLCVRKRP